jgi:CheY-like chemotaxis protein
MISETRKPRVLVVDDDPAIRMVCAVNLELAGLEVLTAEDGLRGLKRARADPPDLVVLAFTPSARGPRLAARSQNVQRCARTACAALAGLVTQPDDRDPHRSRRGSAVRARRRRDQARAVGSARERVRPRR